MKKFPIRVYSKKELALCYFPNSLPRTANNHLIKWINQNNELLKLLDAAGYRKKSKSFSPRQVELITDFLGSPDGYE